MKVLSFCPASPRSPFKITIQFRRSFFQWLTGGPLVISIFTDHFTYWSELPISGIQVTCDSETTKFLDALRSSLESELKQLPKEEQKAFQAYSTKSISR